MVDAKSFGKRLRILMDEYGDTVYTLGEYLGVSPSTVSRYVSGVFLPKKTAVDAIARRYGMSMDSGVRKIPLLGSVAAGVPLLAEQNEEGNVWAAESENVDFALKVKGSSMINAGIFDGDIVFVRKQNDVSDGEIAVVLVGDEATVKRVYRSGESVRLHPENADMNDIIYEGSELCEIKILGKVIFAHRKVCQ